MTKDPQTPDPEKARWDAAFDAWAATWPERHAELMAEHGVEDEQQDAYLREVDEGLERHKRGPF